MLINELTSEELWLLRILDQRKMTLTKACKIFYGLGYTPSGRRLGKFKHLICNLQQKLKTRVEDGILIDNSPVECDSDNKITNSVDRGEYNLKSGFCRHQLYQPSLQEVFDLLPSYSNLGKSCRVRQGLLEYPLELWKIRDKLAPLVEEIMQEEFELVISEKGTVLLDLIEGKKDELRLFTGTHFTDLQPYLQGLFRLGYQQVPSHIKAGYPDKITDLVKYTNPKNPEAVKAIFLQGCKDLKRLLNNLEATLIAPVTNLQQPIAILQYPQDVASDKIIVSEACVREHRELELRHPTKGSMTLKTASIEDSEVKGYRQHNPTYADLVSKGTVVLLAAPHREALRVKVGQYHQQSWITFHPC